MLMFQREVLTMLQAILLCLLILGDARGDYWDDRKQFIESERNMFLGSDIKLDQKEESVNEILMAAKEKEYTDAFTSFNNVFAPARHFFEAKEQIDNSEVFKIIQMMPKGFLLHGHVMGLSTTNYLLKTLTYRDDLYACLDTNGYFRLRFLQTPNANCNWILVSELRRNFGDEGEFDAWLTQKLTLAATSKESYSDTNSIWSALEKLFITVSGILTYRPVFEEYIYNTLKELHEDNVMYIEYRATMDGVYELDGTMLSSLETATIFHNIVNTFTRNHPGFLGGRVIYAPSRKVDNSSVLKYLDEFKKLREALPNFVAGFDLVGQEDLGFSLAELIEPLLKFKYEGAHFFFHAGETNWQDETDLNLIDAILLNTTRIGHGYALNKHPLALKMVKQRGIAIEVNPISNQVLMLVEDIRNHPAASLMADNYPIVIGSDAPSFWGAQGLSYDFYMAFMGLSGRHADLRTLKKLALNSIEYSAMPDEEKYAAQVVWETQWNTFLNNVIHERDNLITFTDTLTIPKPNLHSNTRITKSPNDEF